MSELDNAKIDARRFTGGRARSNAITELGSGDDSRLRPRRPGPPFEQAVRLLSSSGTAGP
ncbi:MAG: hypothetical protein MUC77_06370 [Chromatiaceae bacterium]|jgi:hypothetical protein|nr:hypothetical protein [Chromatiaceae bacterium]